jgi:hypothetical protein
MTTRELRGCARARFGSRWRARQRPRWLEHTLPFPGQHRAGRRHPINPIKNTYDMSGTRITRFRVELQDQHGDRVDTRSEEYNCTIVIEYESPSSLAAVGR